MQNRIFCVILSILLLVSYVSNMNTLKVYAQDTQKSDEKEEIVQLFSNLDSSTMQNAKTLSTSTQTTTVVDIKTGGEYKCFKFTPSATATYVFESTGEFDTYGYLYDSSGVQIQSNDDGGESRNFKLTYQLTSGTTYYFRTRFYSASQTGVFDVYLRRNYVISYDSGGINSTMPPEQLVPYGDFTKICSEIPTTTDTQLGSTYTFANWKTNSITYKPNDEFYVTTNTTLLGKWTGGIVSEAYKYNLRYDVNGGSGTPPTEGTMSLILGGNGTKNLTSHIPIRFGYRFCGWEDSSGNLYLPNEEVHINFYTDLTAKWEESESISENTQATNNATISIGNTMRYYSFTPSTTGTYAFESVGSSDTYGYIYNSTGQQLAYNDDGGESANFRVTYKMTAGTKYYLAAKYYNSSKTGSFDVKLRRQYTISYNANGGSGAPMAQIKLYGDTLTLSSAVPTKEGYKFVGWATSSDATTASYASGGEFSSNGNCTLYAVWQSETLEPPTITTNNLVGGKQIIINCPGTTIYYTRDGNTPTTDSSNGQDSVYLFASSTQTIKAFAMKDGYQSDIVTKTVTVNKTASPTGSETSGKLELSCSDSGATIYYTTDGTTPTVSSTIYSSDIDVTNITTVKAIAVLSGNSNSNVYTWNKVSYTVTYDYATNGGTFATKTTDTVSAGETADLSVTATKNGWEFVGWNTNKYATAGLLSYTVNSNATLYAIYKKTYTANFYSGNNEFQEAKSVTIYNTRIQGTIVPPIQNEYEGWSPKDVWWSETETGSVTYHQSITMGEPGHAQDGVNLYAVYYRNIAVSYKSDDVEIKKEMIEQIYNSKTGKEKKTITLIDEPQKDGFIFEGWMLDGDLNQVYAAGEQIKIDDNCTLEAVWRSESIVANGTCGENATWELDNEGILTISGFGDMYDWDYESPWELYYDSITAINIEDGITSIGNNAFDTSWTSNGYQIKNAVIPNSVTKIGEDAFSGCRLLESVSLSNNLISIGEDAFGYCDSLKSITLPDSVESIDSGAFRSCKTLSSICLPINITNISWGMFDSCINLKSVTISGDIDSIEKMVFYGCTNLTDIYYWSTQDKWDKITIDKYGNDRLDSVNIHFSYTLPVISVSDILGGKKVEISCELENATIYYTTDGTPATTESYVYTDAFEIYDIGTTVIQAIAVVDGHSDSETVAEEVTVEIMPSPKTSYTSKSIAYNTGIVLSVNGDFENCIIYYTTDGTLPTSDSEVFDGKITIYDDVTINAVAIADGYATSEMSSFLYVVPKFTITYDANGGIGEPNDQTKRYGETIYISETSPIRTNFLFRGWSLNENGQIIAFKPGDPYQKEESNTLFASWVDISANIPSLSTSSATEITKNSAVLHGAIVDDGNSDVITKRFVYYEKDNPNAEYSVVADENFSATIDNLKSGTEYWYYAEASNIKGYANGNIVKFTTETDTSKISKFTITPSVTRLKKGKTLKLSTTILPSNADNKTIIWESENENIATVDSTGKITAVDYGTTVIKGITEVGRLVSKCNITVSDDVDEIDFSEWNMASNTSSASAVGWAIPLADLSMGGNIQRASGYLTRWSGPILEGTDTYPSDNKGRPLLETTGIKHVQEIIFIPKRKTALDNDTIKQMIMQYGAVHSSYNSSSQYYSDGKKTYYTPIEKPAKSGGHAITIVGWNDDYDKSNFVITPEGNGAFICKNSYGEATGENGYFYISYYDKSLAIKSMSAVYCNPEEVDNYNSVYQYDPLGPLTSISGSSEFSYCANVFPEKGKTTQSNELLTAVSFYTHTQGMKYDIFIIPDYTDSTDFLNMKDPVLSGTMKYAGYHTVDLKEAISIEKGKRFAVVVKLTSIGGDARQYVEKPLSYAKAKANEDESYFSYDGKLWEDLHKKAENTNACIKAFTKNLNTLSLEQNGLTDVIDNANRPYVSDKVYTVEECLASGDILSQEYIDYCSQMELFSDNGDTEATAEIPNSIEVDNDATYLDGSDLPAKYDLRDYGFVTSVKHQGDYFNCWAFAAIGSLESCYLKANFESTDGGELDGAENGISFVNDSQKMAVSTELQLNLNCYPYDLKNDVVYRSSNPSVASVDTGGRVTAIKSGTATIIAEIDGAGLSSACDITVTSGTSVESVSLSDDSIIVQNGKSIMLDYEVYPADAVNKNVTWCSSDEKVFTVNELGTVTILSPGIATLTVKTVDGGHTDICDIIVKGNTPCVQKVISNNITKYRTFMHGDVITQIWNLENEKQAVAFIGVYDENGKLVHLQKDTVDLVNGNNQKSFTLDIDGINKDKPYDIKIFLWEGFDTLMPLCNQNIINID